MIVVCAGVRFDRLADRLLAAWPDRFIPVGNGGQPPTPWRAPRHWRTAANAASV